MANNSHDMEHSHDRFCLVLCLFVVRVLFSQQFDSCFYDVHFMIAHRCSHAPCKTLYLPAIVVPFISCTVTTTGQCRIALWASLSFNLIALT